MTGVQTCALPIFLFAAIIFAASANDNVEKCSHKNFNMCASNKSPASWDYILHVQTWAGQFCHSKCCDLPKTTMAIRSGFTMHGWWPNFISGYPSCCKSIYTPDKIRSIIAKDAQLKQDLAMNWPSLTKCLFFNYEYDKHGTCLSNVYDGETGPRDYAEAAMKLQNEYDMWKAFQNAGVVADGKTSYKKSMLRQVAEKENGVSGSVYFTCSGRYLQELRQCTTVDKATKANPTVIACPSQAFKEETCGDSIIFEQEPVLTDGGCDY